MTRELPLNSIWKIAGATFTEDNGWIVPQAFSSTRNEVLAAKEKAAFMDISNRARLKVSGKDRVNLLNNILTNDIKSLKPGQGCHSALLTPQGKILMDMNVLIFDDHILMDTEPGYGDKLATLLRTYIITEDVTIEDISSLITAFHLLGPFAKKVLRTLFSDAPFEEEDFSFTQIKFNEDKATLINKHFLEIPCYELCVPVTYGASIAEKLIASKLQAYPLGLKAYETIRINAGVLRYGKDMDENTLLSETGLDQTIASDTKGCYPGQEVIAKIRTYKGLKRIFCKLIVDEGKVVRRDDSILNSKKEETGRITSVAAANAGEIPLLGYIKINDYDRFSSFFVGSDTCSSPAKIKPLNRIL